MSAIEIRRFSPHEAAELQRIRLQAMETSGGNFASSLEDELKRDEAHYAALLAERPVWGAFTADGAVGMAGFNRHEGTKVRHRGVLWGMFVAPSARGQGVAERLVNTVLAHAAEVGVEQVLLTCKASNPVAVRLYERMGFKGYGLEPRALKDASGAYFDDLLMVRML